VEMIKEAGHVPHMEQADTVLPLIREFLGG
jgi:hypothetical protein